MGLGWVGQEIARVAQEDPRVRLVGVCDEDPAKAGRDLGELIGEGRIGMAVEPDVVQFLARTRPEVAVICTTSLAEDQVELIEACVEHGAHVVTTCETLVDPEAMKAALPADLDARARESGVVVLATGVNPGFAMDRLPVMLSKATRNIRRVRVARVIDAASRRAQLQLKAGIGMTPEQFREARGRVGHSGLVGSLRLIAKGLGVTLDHTTESLQPVIARYFSGSSVLGPVDVDRVRGIYQIARGFRARRELITLELTIALDEPNPRDTIDIVGEPPLHFEGEIPGDACTVATVLSTIPVVVGMPAGLRTVLEVPLEQPEEPLRPAAELMVESRAVTRLPGAAELEAPELLPRLPPEASTGLHARLPPSMLALPPPPDLDGDALLAEPLPTEIPSLAPPELPPRSPSPEPPTRKRARPTAGKAAGSKKKKTTKQKAAAKKAATKKKATKKKTATKKKATKKKTASKKTAAAAATADAKPTTKKARAAKKKTTGSRARSEARASTASAAAKRPRKKPAKGTAKTGPGESGVQGAVEGEAASPAGRAGRRRRKTESAPPPPATPSPGNDA